VLPHDGDYTALHKNKQKEPRREENGNKIKNSTEIEGKAKTEEDNDESKHKG
jgi:hypothetical protein